MTAAGLPVLWSLGCATTEAGPGIPTRSGRFENAYPAPGDTGTRAPAWYFLRRAWVQINRDMEATKLPPVVPLDFEEMKGRAFAVAWLGHSAMLMRAGDQWILFDPTLSEYAGPVQGFGPKRLTRLPFPIGSLPRIDLVLISHDHFDHLDLRSVRSVARQPGGPPRFLVGRGLGSWFAKNVGVVAEEFDWWQSADSGPLKLSFVPAQHSSARTPWSRNRTLWGGWVVEREGRRFYFAGDTAYVKELFADIRARCGPIQLAALPIGAYLPRKWMRFEHTDPAEAVQAHLDLSAQKSFGVHWATFQLGDEEPDEPAVALEQAARRAGVSNFGALPIGGVLDVR